MSQCRRRVARMAEEAWQIQQTLDGTPEGKRTGGIIYMISPR